MLAPAGTCPVFHAAIELIGRRWNGVILQQLLGRPLRFSELRDRIPRITDVMLTQRLRELETAGLVDRSVSSGRPVQVSYALTAIGERLGPVLNAIASWGADWAAEAGTD